MSTGPTEPKNPPVGLADRLPSWFLGLAALVTAASGLIHTFLPDGGASVIAGLDLSQSRAQIVALFAWAGATQIVWGAMLLVIALRYRELTHWALGLLLIERLIHALNMWVTKPATADHNPPEAYATLVVIPIIALVFALSLRR